MNRSQIVFGLVLLSFIIITQSTLAVYNLEALGEKDQSYSDIRYSIANYGFSPYKDTHIASEKPSSLNSCTLQPFQLNAQSTPTQPKTTVLCL